MSAEIFAGSIEVMSAVCSPGCVSHSAEAVVAYDAGKAARHSGG